MCTETNTELGDNHFRGVLIVQREPPLSEWALMAGDVLHSLRSALDNLAYALECKHSGIPANPKKVDVQFLACETAAEFTQRRARRIGRIAPAAQAQIELMQPYNRLDTSKPHWLDILCNASNVDKHRRLLIGVAYGSDTTVEMNGITRLTGHAGPFEDGAVIATFAMMGAPPEFVPNPNYKVSLSVKLPYGWPTWGQTVPRLFQRTADFIESDVFPKLEPFL